MMDKTRITDDLVGIKIMFFLFVQFSDFSLEARLPKIGRLNKYFNFLHSDFWNED